MKKILGSNGLLSVAIAGVLAYQLVRTIRFLLGFPVSFHLVYAAYYAAALRVSKGISPYTYTPTAYPGQWLYPPLLAFLLSPLVRFGFATFDHIWMSLSLLLVLILGLLIAMSDQGNIALRAGLYSLIGLIFLPTQYELLYGEVDVLVLVLCIVGSLILRKRGLSMGSAIMLGIGGAIKIYPLLGGLAYINKHKYLIVPMFITFSLLTIVPFLWIGGFGSFAVFFHTITLLGNRGDLGCTDISLIGALSTLGFRVKHIVYLLYAICVLVILLSGVYFISNTSSFVAKTSIALSLSSLVVVQGHLYDPFMMLPLILSAVGSITRRIRPLPIVLMAMGFLPFLSNPCQSFSTNFVWVTAEVVLFYSCCYQLMGE